jgi:transposase
MSKQTTPRRDFSGMKERRLKAAKLFHEGVKPAEVARRLDVSRQSVSRWYHAWKRGGAQSLKGAGRAGRMPKLTKEQLQEVEKALLRGPRANEVNGDLWSLSRMAKVIREITGVTYHPGHVWRILRQMGWSAQRPAKRAAERDEEAVDRWLKETWPAVKKTPENRRP